MMMPGSVASRNDQKSMSDVPKIAPIIETRGRVFHQNRLDFVPKRNHQNYLRHNAKTPASQEPTGA